MRQDSSQSIFKDKQLKLSVRPLPIIRFVMGYARSASMASEAEILHAHVYVMDVWGMVFLGGEFFYDISNDRKAL